MNPTCREIEGLLSPYLDRELDPLVARRVDEHVSSCPVCSDALAAMREAGRILAAAVPLRSEAEWEALALRVEMAIDREEARVFQEAAKQELVLHEAAAHTEWTPVAAMRTATHAAPKREKATRSRGFGWWAYGSGAIAAAMLVVLLWPWLKSRVEEGPPVPSPQDILMDAPSTTTEQEQSSVREPASTATPEKTRATASDSRQPAASAPEAPPSVKRDGASTAERKLVSSGGEAPATLSVDQDAQRNGATGGLQESGATKQFVADQNAPQQSALRSAPQQNVPPATQTVPQQKSFSQQKTKAGTAAPSPETQATAPAQESATKDSRTRASEPQPSAGEQVQLEKATPQPISKKETSPVWRPDQSTNGFRAKSKSAAGPTASDTPPPPTVKHFSETEWAEMSELQTQEALKTGTEKSLAEATQVLEGFLKQYPRSAFRTQTSANLLRTTSALVQLNPNLWCEKAVAALDNWKLEKPSPAINVDAEIATIQGRCLK